MKTLLQTVLFPDRETCDAQDCYFRENGKEQIFNTYFNLFSLKKWRIYTDLNNITLQIKARGNACIRLWAYTEDQEERLLSEIKLGTNGGQSETEYEISFPYHAQDDFLWFSFERQSTDAEIVSAGYITTDTPRHQPKIAINICTFKREEYVYRNMDVLKRSILSNQEHPCHDRFRVYIVDNGQSLQNDRISSEYISIIPNRNVGGSGGFTRGILEILKEREQYQFTHMIFMDDDAVLEPDALVRTIALLSFLKEDYKDVCIGGAMHRLDLRYIQHESGAIWNGVTPVRNHEGVDLRSFTEVIDNETILPTSYAGWWYACYPLTVVREDNLPMPMFIHCDDMEYGIRNQDNGFVFLNGICVWHNSFEHRRSSSLSYYDIRNIMIMNALIYPDGNEKAWVRSLWKRVIGDLFRYRYKDVYIKCLGITDFLKGPQYFKAIDPVDKLREVNAMGYQLYPVDELTKDPETLEEIRQYHFPTELNEIYGRKKQRSRINNNTVIDKKRGCKLRNLHFPVYPMGLHPIYALHCEKKVLLFDPYNNYGMIVQRSVTETWKCLRFFCQTLRKLNKRYFIVQQEYRKNVQAVCSKAYWDKYLM